jgi:glucose-6-phosphate 1-epimerase
MADPVVVEVGNGGLERIRVSGPRADAEIYLQGGHVTHWQPRGAAPVLFLSPRAVFAPGNAIRGGVPVIFPWFGPHATDRTKPMHGFARSRTWRLITSEPDRAGAVVVELGLCDDDATRALWPSRFDLHYRVTIGETLGLTLTTTNTSPAPFAFEAALHTYLAVGDVERIEVAGLEHTTYIDKVDAMTRKRHGAAPLRLAGETDRVFLGTTARCVVGDPALNRRLVVDKSGSASTVVWNPGATKAAGIADLEPDGWRRMVCVETANAADDAITLAPGGRHVMSATIRVETAV